ncbi:MAG: hypothetical protein Kow0042_05890 [Calditrichia bacterium]
MNKPSYYDFNLNHKIIQDIEDEIKKLSIRESAFINRIRFGLILLICIPFVFWTKGRLNYFELPLILIALIIIGYSLGKILGKYLFGTFYKSNFFQSENYRNYRAYLREQRKYDHWFTTRQKSFWQNLKGLRFEAEIANLLKQVGYNIKSIREKNEDLIGLIIGSDTSVLCLPGQIPLTADTVRTLFQSLPNYGYHKALFISQGGYEGKCYRYVRGKPIRLWNISHLIDLQKQLQG